MAAAPEILGLASLSRPSRSRRLIRDFAERPGFAQLASGLGDIGALALEIIRDRAAQIGIGNVMRGVGGLRQVAARDLVLALRAGLDRFEAALDGEIDRLVVADLEMQKRVMLDRAPVAAEQRVRSDEVDGAGDPAIGGPGHYQQHT